MSFLGRACLATALMAAACSGNPATPSGAGPRAVLSILAGVTPALGMHGFSMLVFDGARSTGDGLSYTWAFGDGTGSSDPIAGHVSSDQLSLTDRLSPTRELTARLTVTDRFGRTSSAEQLYTLARIESGRVDWWHAFVTKGQFVELVNVRRNGSLVSGTYWERPLTGAITTKPFTGTLSGLRTISIRSTDGTVELTGTMEWQGNTVVLQLAARGGLADGVTLLFQFDDPY